MTNENLDELRTILTRLRDGGYYSNEDQFADAARGLELLGDETGQVDLDDLETSTTRPMLELL